MNTREFEELAVDSSFTMRVICRDAKATFTDLVNAY